MSSFVLVHGAWHGAWCWRKLTPLLVAKGHRVQAPDLLGMGQDRTPSTEVTLDRWTDQICRIVDGQAEPVILVGHSRAGLIISQVAERRPRKIKKLVYLCAMLVKSGETGLQALSAQGPVQLQTYLVPSDDGVLLSIREDGLKPCFFGMCSDANLASAKPLVQPEPLQPSTEPVVVSDANFGRVPRVYIECLRDGAIPPALQKAMYTATPCERVITMDTDHSPFFSAPEELARHLMTL